MASAQKALVPNAVEDQLDVEENYAEFVLFQVTECYVYKIPPRKSAASHRADEWDINKWAWEGALKVVSKGNECQIRLIDPKTGELYAQAPINADQPLPVEAVIDSSRFFVLRIEDMLAKSGRHAFIGLGFRERPEAYDFQAALYDHVKYINKKKEAAEMEQEYQSKPQVDYSLKAGETIRLDIKPNSRPKSALGGSFFAQQLGSPVPITPPAGATNPLRSASAEKGLRLLPPPPPSNIGSLTSPRITQSINSDTRALVGAPGPIVEDDGKGGVLEQEDSTSGALAHDETRKEKGVVDVNDDDDFGDFQAA